MARPDLPFVVQAYSHDTLVSMMADHSEASPEVIADKDQLKYLKEYFGGIGAQTILLEKHYIDHDYLEDYAGYYVKCFHRYKRRCTRIHFFSVVFKEEDFLRAIETNTAEAIIPHEAACAPPPYLGFIVVRPLPRFVIGRTCLVPYNTDSDRRLFPTGHDYPVNLYGISLRIPTVAFQEQDTVTAACATSALWSAFQVTGRRFQHRLPSPVQITKSATDHAPLRSRPFPNTDGLTLEQMAFAIRDVGLEPFNITPSSSFFLKSACYAYLKAGIPVLLLHELTAPDGSARRTVGYHAVAVTGVSLPKTPAKSGVLRHTYVCDRIDKIYVHDDQVGPYARMEFHDYGTDWWLSTFWGSSNLPDVRAVPRAVLVPLYNKIRIPAKIIYQEVVNLITILNVLKVSGLEWDVHLTSNIDLKSEVLELGTFGAHPAPQLLLQDLPRFMWRVSASSGDTPIVDILFDATDIDSGQYILRLEIYDDAIRTVLTALCEDKTLAATPVGAATARLFHKIRTPHHSE